MERNSCWDSGSGTEQMGGHQLISTGHPLHSTACSCNAWQIAKIAPAGPPWVSGGPCSPWWVTSYSQPFPVSCTNQGTGECTHYASEIIKLILTDNCFQSEKFSQSNYCLQQTWVGVFLCVQCA